MSRHLFTEVVTDASTGSSHPRPWLWTLCLTPGALSPIRRTADLAPSSDQTGPPSPQKTPSLARSPATRDPSSHAFVPGTLRAMIRLVVNIAASRILWSASVLPVPRQSLGRLRKCHLWIPRAKPHMRGVVKIDL